MNTSPCTSRGCGLLHVTDGDGCQGGGGNANNLLCIEI